MEHLFVCVYERRVREEEIYSTQDCSLCGKHMQYKEQKLIDNDECKIIDEYILERMKTQIELMGNDRFFKTIENISSAVARIHYRKYFLLAGGKIPETEI